MSSRDLSPISRSRGLVPALLFAPLLGLLTACPVKPTCPNCHVSGVMAEGGTPSAAPNSALNVQVKPLRRDSIKEIRVTLSSADGASETLTYAGDQIAGVNATSTTAIPDAGLYDVEGKAPSKAEIEIVFKDGSTLNEPLTIEAESSGGATRR